MLTTTAVDIAWDPIECLQRHGLTLSIVVRIATGSLRVERVVPDTGAYRRDALQPDVSYTLGVFVRYENVAGEIGAMITVTTLPQGECSRLSQWVRHCNGCLPCLHSARKPF